MILSPPRTAQPGHRPALSCPCSHVTHVFPAARLNLSLPAFPSRPPRAEEGRGLRADRTALGRCHLCHPCLSSQLGTVVVQAFCHRPVQRCQGAKSLHPISAHLHRRRKSPLRRGRTWSLRPACEAAVPERGSEAPGRSHRDHGAVSELEAPPPAVTGIVRRANPSRTLLGHAYVLRPLESPLK